MNSMLKDKIEKKSIKKKTKNNSSQPKLIYQTRNQSHKMGITS